MISLTIMLSPRQCERRCKGLKQLEQKRSGDKGRGQIARPSVLRLMLHGGEIDHERSGPKIVNHCLFGLCAYGQRCFS